DALNRCSACHSVVYCDQKCQKKHWKIHRKECSLLKEYGEYWKKLGLKVGNINAEVVPVFNSYVRPNPFVAGCDRLTPYDHVPLRSDSKTQSKPQPENPP